MCQKTTHQGYTIKQKMREEIFYLQIEMIMPCAGEEKKYFCLEKEMRGHILCSERRKDSIRNFLCFTVKEVEIITVIFYHQFQAKHICSRSGKLIFPETIKLFIKVLTGRINSESSPVLSFLICEVG